MNGLRALNVFYNKSYNKRPILTLCVTNGILGIISDSLAQSISLYNKLNQKMEDRLLPDKIKEHHDMWSISDHWDLTRTLRFAAYNFCVAPLGGKWYMFLDKFFPMPLATGAVSKAVQSQITKKANMMAIKRMVTDQVLFAPAGLVLFFTTMGLAETGKWEGVQEKFRDAYVPALIANYKVWPAVQFINFKWMPLQYRLPFVSSLGIVWNAYLSWLNNASKQEESVLEKLERKDTGLEIVQST
ncbi:Protein sym1 [Choanephora cucurbitarum]|uniref:Protein sym1 n=1 Tax=Choanephora cucurbitarum TaxID=101091 RepID=A0A1C7ND90_9FUNG|nr:Protein sym1 [Choanephora cucurbitarum]